MNSSQLLNVLNKQSHNKHNKKQQGKQSTIQTSSLNEGKTIAVVKQNEFSQIKLTSSAYIAPPQFLTTLLNQQLQQGLVNKSLQQIIKKICKQKQKNVYLAFNDSHIAYLSQLSVLAVSKNQYGTESISDVMLKRLNFVTGDLESGKIIINHDRAISSKEQIQQFADLDRARLLKIKDGAIRSKLDLLNLKMEQMQKIHQSPKKNSQSLQAINKKIQQNLDLANYNLQSQKTKIAKDYIKFMSQQRKEQRKRQKMREQRRLKAQKQRQAELKQAQQMRDLSKKQQILQRIQQKRKKRQQQQKQIAEKQQNIDKFLQKYRQQMPVFKKKVRQFEQKYIKPEKAYRQQKLKQIKEKKKSYSLNDITDHEKKYQQIKKKQTQRKISQKQMYLKSLKVNTKQYYKGSIHKFVEQIDRQVKQKDSFSYQVSKNKKQKMWDYAKQVKQQYKPKIDENKRGQIIKLLQKHQMKNNKMQKKYKPVINSDGEQIGVETFYQPKKQKNRYNEGNKFMIQGNLKRKKIISQSVQTSSLQNKQKQSQKQTEVKILQKSQTFKQKIVNEKDIWKLRSKQLQQMSNNFNSHKQFEQVKVNFQNLDKRAADKQKLMKHSKLSVDQYIQQKGALDQFYLQSIKHKMKLLQ